MSTTSGTGAISFSGLFSGLDTENIIKQLMVIEAQPQQLLQNKKLMLGYQKDALNTANSSLLALQTSLKDFKNGVIMSNSAVSDDEKVVTASADASATEGTYTFSVIDMAYAHRVASDAQGAAYGGAGGSLRFTIGADIYTVNVNNGDSLNTIAHNINNSMSGGTNFMKDATATVITNPIGGLQTLVIESKNTGTANAIGITNVGAATVGQDLGILKPDNSIKNTLQAAQNAQVSINGVTISNSTNSISTAVAGVTFNIEGFGTADVSVGPDDSKIVASVKAFVDQFNKTTDLLDGYIKEQSVSGATTADEMKQGVLQNDGDLREAKSDIRLKTTGYMDSSLTTYKLLTDIGIDSEPLVGTTISDKITLDESKLTAALKDDKGQVSTLLQGFADQLATYMDSQTKVTVAQSMAGSFYQRVLSIDDQEKELDTQISDWSDKLTVIENRYRTEYTNMEQTLATLQSQGNYLLSQLGVTSSSSSSSKSSS
jgi:flagellar hook-associated protein 2